MQAFPFDAGTRPEEKKKRIVRIYMGESPGRTSLTESRGRVGLAKVGWEAEQGKVKNYVEKQGSTGRCKN